MKTSKYPRIGDIVWEVQWTLSIPKDEYGESNHDEADTRVRDFKTEAAARRWAERVYPKDAYGCVIMTKMEFVAYEEGKPYGFWDAAGDPKHYSGEWDDQTVTGMKRLG